MRRHDPWPSVYHLQIQLHICFIIDLAFWMMVFQSSISVWASLFSALVRIAWWLRRSVPVVQRWNRKCLSFIEPLPLGTYISERNKPWIFFANFIIKGEAWQTTFRCRGRRCPLLSEYRRDERPASNLPCQFNFRESLNFGVARTRRGLVPSAIGALLEEPAATLQTEIGLKILYPRLAPNRFEALSLLWAYCGHIDFLRDQLGWVFCSIRHLIFCAQQWLVSYTSVRRPYITLSG